MTVVCGGGASQQKPGIGVTVVMSGASLAALLNNIPTWQAVVIGAALAGATYDLTTMCPADPPDFPTFTLADLVALASPLFDPAAFIGALPKVYQLVKHYAWYQFCECASVATPAPPAAPALPVGAPVLAPPLGGGGISTPCWDKQTDQLVPNDVSTFDATPLIVPTTTTVTVPALGSLSTTAYALPTPTPALMQTRLRRVGTNTGQRVDLTLYAFKADGSHNGTVGANQLFDSTMTDVTLAINIPALTAAWQFGLSGNGLTRQEVVLEAIFFCGAPGALAAPCCPPDPVTAAQIGSILQLVTLLQRQTAPFAYVPGAVHAALSGKGALAVQGLIGMKLQMTTIPAFVGQESGDPDEFFEAGWFSWGNADGFSPRTRITHSPQLSLPADAGVYTSLGYSLTPGVVATITELVREP